MPLAGYLAPQLKSAVADVEELAGKDDRYFLRWLRARKFDLAKAEDMLRKVIAAKCAVGLTVSCIS